MTSVGYATLQIIPSAQGFAAAASAQVSGAMVAAGTAGGRDGGKAAGVGLLAGIKGMVGPIAAVTVGLFAFDALKDAMVDSVRLASDLSEQANVIQVTFAGAAKQIEAFAATGPRALGMSKLAAQEAAATFGLFGKMAGLAGTDLVGFSTDLVKLSVDLASFRNAKPEEVVEALGAALRGEAEPARRFGILLDDATLRIEAMRLGIIKTTKEALTPQQKVLAAHAVIMKQSTDAQGDFARTSNGLANQQRILSAQWEDLKTKLGAHFLPVVLKVTTAATNLFDSFDSGGGKLAAFIAPAVTLGRAFKSLFGDDGAQGFGEQMDNAFGNTGKYVSSFRDIGQAILNVKDTVVSGGRAFMDAFGPVKPLIDDLKAAVQERFAVVMDIIRDLTPVFNDLKTKGTPVFAKLGEAVRMAADVIVPAFRATTDVLKVLWALFGPTVVSVVKNTFNAIWGILSGAFTIIKGVFEVLKGLFTGDWALMWQGVKNIFGGAWEAIKAVLVGALGIIWDLIVRLFGGIGAWIADTWNATVEWFVGTISAIPGRIWGFIQSIPELFKEGISQAAYWVGYGIALIVKGFIELPGVIWGLITSLWRKGVQLTNDGVNAVVGWFLRFVTDSAAHAEALPGKIWATITSLWDKGKTLTSDGVSAVVDYVKSLPGKASEAASTLPQKIWDALVSAVDKAKTIGANIIQGLIDGIGSMVDKLTGVVSGIASKIKDGFKDALGINSPSRVFKGFGGFLMQGLAIGIRDDANRVMRAVRAVSDGLARSPFALPIPTGGVSGALAAAGAGSQKTLNYYAAPGNSLGEEDLFAAADRTRMVW